MNNQTNDDVLQVIMEVLGTGSSITITPTGYSMCPMIKNIGKDTVTLSPVTLPLKKYDIPLYKSTNNRLVIHRIIKINKNGNFTMAGDNSFYLEHNVSPDSVIGVVTSFNRKGKDISCKSIKYKIYVRFWTRFMIVKRVYLKSFKHKK